MHEDDAHNKPVMGFVMASFSQLYEGCGRAKFLGMKQIDVLMEMVSKK